MRDINVKDVNLDNDGYLISYENSTSIRKAIAEALKHIDFHSNGTDPNWSGDLIYGRQGLGKWPDQVLYTDRYDYTALGAFLFIKRYLEVYLPSDSANENFKPRIVFKNYNLTRFKGQMSNINGPRFEKELKDHLSNNELQIFPIFGSLPDPKNLLFSIDLENDELKIRSNRRGDKFYFLKAEDIFFPKGYDPFE